MLPIILFAYFAVVIVWLSLVTITRKNPVHSVLWMLVLFFHIAGLYLLLNAEFLAAVQVILYAGAILVLFLFVVMMLNLKEELSARHYVRGWPSGAAAGVCFLTIVLLIMRTLQGGPAGRDSIESIKSASQTKAIGKALYTVYLFPFEAASLILLVAIVGAIVLAKRGRT